MTTIVFSRREGLMAADSRAYSGGALPIGQKDKLMRLADGSIAGVSSRVVGASRFYRAWVEDRTPIPAEVAKDIVALRVSEYGEVFYMSGAEAETGPLNGDFFAIGTGDCFALGAMLAGAKVIRAVEIAIALDIWSGGPIVTLPVRPAKKRVRQHRPNS